MADESQVQRQWIVLNMVAARRQGATIQDMVSETGVNARTIRRDLNVLRTVGFPLQESLGERGRKHWQLFAGQALPPMPLTWEEAAALAIAQRLLDPLAGTRWWTASRSAFQKLRATLSEPALKYLDKLAIAFHQTARGTTDYTARTEVIDRLMEAIEDRRITLLAYQSPRATEPVTTEVYPFCLVWHRQALYLVAHSTTHEEMRTYKIDRVHEVDSQTLRFARPEEFDPTQYLEHSFGIFRRDVPPQRVRVRFSAEVVHILREKTFHPSQQLSAQRDGKMIAEYQLDTFEEFTSWILSFGRHAEVLEPAAIRDNVIEQLTSALAGYAPPASAPPATQLKHEPPHQTPKHQTHPRHKAK